MISYFELREMYNIRRHIAKFIHNDILIVDIPCGNVFNNTTILQFHTHDTLYIY